MGACGRSQFSNLAREMHPVSATGSPTPAYTHSVFSRVSGTCQPNAHLADKLPVASVETRIFYSEWS